MNTWGWREEASPRAQADLDGLLEPAPGFAWTQLTKYGEFYPYAYALRDSGELVMVQAAPSVGNDRPAPRDVIVECQQALIRQREELRATAMVADVRLPDGRDAVRIEFEHAAGVALMVHLPYKKKRFRRKIERGEQIVTRGRRVVWP